MKLSDIHNIEIRMCWPDPDDVCLEGGCVHCAEGANSAWVPLNDVYAYVNRRRDSRPGRGNRWVSLWKAFWYGAHHDWHNLPKRKLNVRRARAWHGTLTDRNYTGWEHMQRED